MVILITMPSGMGTEEIQSVLFGWSLGYPGRLSVFSITGPHPGRKRTKMQSWHGRTNSLFTMALKSLIVVVRCQFIFLYIFIFLILFVNVVKDIYLFIYPFIYLSYFIFISCFSFKTLPESYKPLQDTKTHSMPRLTFTHHIFISFILATILIFLFFLLRYDLCSHLIPL